MSEPRLNRDQKYMLAQYTKHTAAIAWVAWMAEPLVKLKYLKPAFSLDGEVFYCITRRGAALSKSHQDA